MKHILFIGSGSFIGGISRYLLSQAVEVKFLSSFPAGTLVVNITGCFLIGVIYGISERVQISPEIRLFLTTGILGGFTTFSAFSNDTVSMINSGQILQASIYITVSVVIGILATMVAVFMVS